MRTNELKRVMHVAYVLHDNKPDFPFADCLRYAWWFWHFHRALLNGVCKFSYFKREKDADGNRIRPAVGTLNELLIPIDKRPKGDMSDGAARVSYTACAYYDLEKGEWRSFRYVDFIGYVDFWELKEGLFVRQDNRPSAKREK